MASRLGARLLTGPLAFLLGGLIEVGALVLRTWRGRLRRRGGHTPDTSGPTAPRAPGS